MAVWPGALSAADSRGLRLAVEARTLGSQGGKEGADMGAVLLAGDEDTAAVLGWGCARTLERFEQEEAGAADGPPVKRNRKQKGGGGKEGRIDVHAEADAIAMCARLGVATDGATCYITGAPCQRCLGQLVSCGVRRVVYVDCIARHCKPEQAERQHAMAAQNGVELVDECPMPPYAPLSAATRSLPPHPHEQPGDAERVYAVCAARASRAAAAAAAAGAAGAAADAAEAPLCLL